MTGDKNLVSLGDLSKVAETLINRVSDAVGGIAKPWQIVRVAKAEAEAELVRAEARVEVTEIEQRAILRMVKEEGKKQENIEAITRKSLEYLSDDSKPEELDDDWLAHFFDRSRTFSDTEARTVWAKVLAAESNKPNTFSRRTIDTIAGLSKEEAENFSKLASFIWNIEMNDPILVLPNKEGLKFGNNGLIFQDIVALDAAGLIHFQNLSAYHRQGYREIAAFTYFNQAHILKFTKEEIPEGGNRLSTGSALLTQAGSQLAMIVDRTKDEEYERAVLAKWQKEGAVEIHNEELPGSTKGKKASQPPDIR